VPAPGVADESLENGIRLLAWHFGMLPNRPDCSRLATPFPFVLAFLQARTEKI
jgi:hypothetical protein